MLQSDLTKQLVEADILLFIETERRFITRCSSHLIGLVCQFSVCIHIWLKKGSRLGSGSGLAEQAFCRTNDSLSDKNTACSPQVRRKIRGGESLTEVSKILRYGFWGRVCSWCNITTVSGQKSHRCGLERTSESGWKMKMYIAAERIIRINKRMIKSIFIGFVTQSNKRFDKEGEKYRIKKISI